MAQVKAINRNVEAFSTSLEVHKLKPTLFFYLQGLSKRTPLISSMQEVEGSTPVGGVDVCACVELSKKKNLHFLKWQKPLIKTLYGKR